MKWYGLKVNFEVKPCSKLQHDTDKVPDTVQIILLDSIKFLNNNGITE